MSANDKKGSFKFKARVCEKRCGEIQSSRCYLNYGQMHCVAYLKETINPTVEKVKQVRSRPKRKRPKAKRRKARRG